MTLLSGKVAVVTGGGRGIGRATAVALARAGAVVVVNDVDESVAVGVVEGLGGGSFAVVGDLTEPEVPGRLVAATVERLGRLDIVVNNAGYNWDGPLAEMTDEQFQAMLDIHLVAPFRVLRAAAPYLIGPAKRERREGVEVFRKVVNVSSVSGTMGNPNQANYNAGKAGIIGITKGLAKEWGEWKVNVNAVAPGFIDTRLTGLEGGEEVIAVGGREVGLGIPQEHRDKGTELVCLGRPGAPEEVAEAIVFLCSPSSNYIHGQVVGVTGGLTLGLSS